MRALLAALVAAVLLATFWPARARAVDRNFAGSAQLDYAFVPTQRSNTNYTFDGFTTELSVKLAADVSDHVSANVKLCYGCHGFEMDMAYFDFRAADELNLRVGRFSPSFGSFNLRHDVANHKLSDKPLPYDMGRMLRFRSWNLGVLPSPFPDNGAEIDGTHWFGQAASLDYAVYAVAGFKAGVKPTDIDFTQSRQLYYVDNNGRPTVGSRVALTFKLDPSSDLTLGTSAMYGTYDPSNDLSYLIVGGDVSLRVDKTNVRAEYLARRQQFDTSNPGLFKYLIAPSSGDFFMKHGAYLEVDGPLSPDVDLVGRVDGMYRVGNVLADPTILLSRKSSVLRYTLGSVFTLERGLRLKLSTELWQWSNDDANGHGVDVSVHLAAVGTF